MTPDRLISKIHRLLARENPGVDTALQALCGIIRMTLDALPDKERRQCEAGVQLYLTDKKTAQPAAAVPNA